MLFSRDRRQVIKSIVFMAYAIDTVFIQNLLASICLVFQKHSLQQFSLLGGLSKQL